MKMRRHDDFYYIFSFVIFKSRILNSLPSVHTYDQFFLSSFFFSLTILQQKQQQLRQHQQQQFLSFMESFFSLTDSDSCHGVVLFMCYTYIASRQWGGDHERELRASSIKNIRLLPSIVHRPIIMISLMLQMIRAFIS